LTAKTPEDPSGTSDRKNFVVFSGQVNFGSDGVSVLTDLLDPRFDDFPLEVWYYSKFGEDIDKAPYYHRMYYEEFGAYISGFTGPDDPEYIKTLGSIRNVNTNRRKGDDDISEGSPKHVSIMVKENPIVQLHVPNTIVNSSVTTRDEQAPHLINVTSWWTGTEEKEKKDDDPHDGGITKDDVKIIEKPKEKTNKKKDHPMFNPMLRRMMNYPICLSEMMTAVSVMMTVFLSTNTWVLTQRNVLWRYGLMK